MVPTSHQLLRICMNYATWRWSFWSICFFPTLLYINLFYRSLIFASQGNSFTPFPISGVDRTPLVCMVCEDVQISSDEKKCSFSINMQAREVFFLTHIPYTWILIAVITTDLQFIIPVFVFKEAAWVINKWTIRSSLNCNIWYFFGP